MREWDEQESVWKRFRRFINRTFPERQIHLRTRGRIRFFRIPQALQLSTLAVAVVATTWFGYSTFSYIEHDEIVVAKDTQIADARRAYDDLLSDVTAYQHRFAELTRELEDNHNLMLSLVERNATLQRNLTTVERRLESTETERESVASARERLKGKLALLEGEMHSLSNKNFSLRDNLNNVETDLQTVLRERDAAREHGSILEQEVAALKGSLNNLQVAQDKAVDTMTERTISYIGSLEKVVEITGVDVGRLMASSDNIVQREGQGGPFIPINPEEAGGTLGKKLVRLEEHLGQWESMQGLMSRMPLAPPMKAYRITSSFGKRRDPLNKRWSAHYGLDFAGPLRSPIYAPAPGVVKQAGTKGRYGWFIEIDHGSGIKTRYAHMHSIMVKRGEKVEFGQKIGQLGNTGRSTGPHLHYEVTFDGKPKDPMKFIKAGRNVFQKQ